GAPILRFDAGVAPDRSAPGADRQRPTPPPPLPSCEQRSQAQCEDEPGCREAHCSDCQGGPPRYTGCVPDDGRELCGGDCPPPPLDCKALDAAACDRESACVADYCYACNALAPVFNGCRQPEE